MELACTQELAYILELEGKLGQICELGHVLEQLCELGLGHKKQFLHRQLRLRFQSRHQQCCRLQFEFGHLATKHGIDQQLSIHHGAHFVRSLLRYSHLEQHIHIDKQLVHLHKLELCHKLVLGNGMLLLVQLHRLRQGGQQRQRRTTM